MAKNSIRFASAVTLSVVLAVMSFCFLMSPAFAAKLPSGRKIPIDHQKAAAEFVPGQVIVKFRNSDGINLMRKPSSFNLKSWHVGPFGYTRIFIDGDINKACSELKKDPNVLVAEPNCVRYLMTTPNDPLFIQNMQLNLKLANAELGWNIETGDAEVVVAVIDTGVDKQHPDLHANLLPGKNFKDDTGDESDDSGHGTAVCGVVGAVGNNGVGVTGSAWNVRILPLRSCGGPGLSCSIFDEAEAIDEAIAQGADIINLSLGGTGEYDIEREACEAAWNAGIVLFAAAGNQGLLGKKLDPDTKDNINYPAGYDCVCGVSSVDYPPNGDLNQIQLSSFSNSGDAVSVTAVGSSVVTTAPSVDVPYLIFSKQVPQPQYGRIDGTSFSTPLVSGMAALIKSHFPNLTNLELRKKVESSVVDIGPQGRDDKFGWGLVDFQKALSGSTFASNAAFNFGVTTSSIMNDDVIVVVKVKQPISGIPAISFSYLENGSLHNGLIPLKIVPNDISIWAGRLHTQFSGVITFKINGVATGGGNLPELSMEYFKGKSN